MNIYTVRHTDLSVSATNEKDAYQILLGVKHKFTVVKDSKLSGCWYKWNVNAPDNTKLMTVKGRNEFEAHRNAINIFGNITEKSLIFAGTENAFVKPSDNSIKYVFTIGDSAKKHGFYVFEAISAKEAWEIGTTKFNTEFPNDKGTRLGLWQRVLVPVHANPMWVAADIAKDLKTPSHFAVDVPVGLGLSDEKWTGPDDMINTNNGVVESVVNKEVKHAVKQ